MEELETSERFAEIMENNREQNTLAEETSTDIKDSRVASAPDVTYDATLLEDQNDASGGVREGGRNEESRKDATEQNSVGEEGNTTREKAVRFEEADEKRTEGDVMNKEGMQTQTQNRSSQVEEKDDWMDILGSGDLKKKVVRTGNGIETRPTPMSRVRIRTRGELDTGTVVDKHASIPFTLGDGDVLQAWDLSVSLMGVGEVALVRTSPRFAYGRLGRSPDVPTNASITYEIELLDVQEPVDFKNVTEKELTTLIDRKRIRGNELFQRKEFELAVHSYDRALKLIESYTSEHAAEVSPAAISDMHVRCLNNLAAAYLKVERYKESQESCQKVLEKDPNNVKALFRYGKVLAIQGELELAVKSLQKALGLNPQERAIQVELQKAVKKKECVDKEEKEMYKRMVNPSQNTTSKKQTNDASTESNGSSSSRGWGPLPYFAVAGLVAAFGIALAYYITQR